MAQKFANAARSALIADIGPTDTSLSIGSSAADLFPVANTGTSAVGTVGKDWFKGVLEDADHNIEIVYVRTRQLGSPGMSNVLRGQEGTTARLFAAGSIVGLRHTAADLGDAISFASSASSFWRTLVGYTTAAASRMQLGISSVGNDLFTAVDAAAARNAIGVTATSSILDAMYPIGSLYINAEVATNPATLLGFGTWAAFGAGKVPVGFDSQNTLFNAAGKTGGSADAAVVSHSHTATVTDPGHSHIAAQPYLSSTYANGGSYAGQGDSRATGSATTGISVSVGNTGTSGANANYQPFITVYMWKRTS